MKNAIKVTTAELTNVLMALPNGIGSIAQVKQITSPKTTKKDRDTKVPFTGEIRKASEVSVIVATDYERNVVNQLNKEGKDKSEYKKGINTMPIDFEGSKNTFAGTYKGEGVIQYRPNPNEKNKPFVEYFLNKKAIDKANLPNVLPVPSKATNQGTKKEILWRKLYVANIKQISIQGKLYENIECEL